MSVALGLVQRIVDNLPVNSARSFESLQYDEAITNCCDVLVDFAKNDLQEVLAPLFATIERQQSARNTSLEHLQSQLFLLRIISRCYQASIEPQTSLSLDSANKVISDRLALKALTCSSTLFDTKHDDSVISQPSKSWSSSRAPKSQEDTRKLSEDELRIHEELIQHAQVITTFVSKHNWSVSLAFFTKVLQNAESSEDGWHRQLRMLCWLSLDTVRFGSLVTILSTKIGTIRKASQLVLAMSFDTAVLNWVQSNPLQFLTAPTDQMSFTEHAGALFLALQELATDQRRRLMIWPILSTLIMCFDGALIHQTRCGAKQFLDQLTREKHGKDNLVILEAQARILHISSVVSRRSEVYMRSLLDDIVVRLRTNLTELRTVVNGGLFQAGRLLIALSRLQYYDLFSTILASWLDNHALSASHVQAVQTVTVLLSDVNTLDQRGLTRCLDCITPRLRELFLASAIKPVDQKPDEQSRDPQLGIELARGLLRIFCLAPALMSADSMFQYLPSLTNSIMRCLLDKNAPSRELGATLVAELQKPECIYGQLFERQMHKLPVSQFLPIWSTFSCYINLAIAKELRDASKDTEDLKFLLRSLIKSMTCRTQTIKHFGSKLLTVQNIREHIALEVAIEGSLMILSCHTDSFISTEAASACVPLIDEIIIHEQALVQTNQHKRDNNLELFRALSQEVFVTQGRNATQRKITRCLLDSSKFTQGIASAWNEIYVRWQVVTSGVLSSKTASPDPLSDELRREWQNQTGFLCSSCRRDRFNVEAPQIRSFIHALVGLLDCKDALLRESCVVAIVRELHSSLYTSFMQQMEIMLQSMKDSNNTFIIRHRNSNLAENFILILKGLFERMLFFLELNEDLHLTALITDLGIYMEACNDKNLRMRFCHMCEAISGKCDLLCLKNETAFKKSLCNTLSRWVPEGSETYQSRVSTDLVLPCLRAITKLTDGLSISTDHTDAGLQVFGSFESFLAFSEPLIEKWSESGVDTPGAQNNTLLQKIMLNVTRSNPPIFDLLHARIANCSLPVKQFYLENIALVVESGTVDALLVPDVKDLQSKLLSCITKHEYAIPALLDSCPSASTCESLADSFLHILQSSRETTRYGSLRISSRAGLFYVMINAEVSLCESDGELFRRNSAVTRVWSLYLKRYGDNYIDKTLAEPISLLANRADTFSIEVDPDKLAPGEDQGTNLENLLSTCSTFITSIQSSIEHMPRILRELCFIITTVAGNKFRDSMYTSIGSFIMLRCLSPAIVSPTLPSLTPRLKRQLLLVVKILTNLANNSFFKEAYMDPVNDYLRTNIEKMTRFFFEISRPQVQQHEASSESESTSTMIDAWEIRQALYAYGDKFKTNFVDLCGKNNIPLEDTRATLENIGGLVMQLESSSATMSTRSQRNSLSSVSPSESSLDFVERPSFETGELDLSEVLYVAGENKNKNPLLCLNLRALQNFPITSGQALVQRILKILNIYQDSLFQLFIDVTSFVHTNQHALLDLFLELLPREAISNCTALFFWNANRLFIDFVRVNLEAVLPLVKQSMIFLNIGDDISRHIDCAKLSLPRSVSDSDKFGMTRLEGFKKLTAIGDEIEVNVFVSRRRLMLAVCEVQKVELMSSVKVEVCDIHCFDKIQNIVTSAGQIELLMLNEDSVILKHDTDADYTLQLKSLIRNTDSASIITTSSNLQKSAPRLGAVLLTVGLLHVTSASRAIRQSSLDLLCSLLPRQELQQIGINKRNRSGSIPLGKLELTALHLLALRRDSNIEVVTSFILTSLVTLSTDQDLHEKLESSRCIKMWLAALLQMPEHDPTDDNYSALRTVQLITALLNAHCRSPDAGLVHLWSALQAKPVHHETVFSVLVPYALSPTLERSHVLKVSQIFRELRSSQLDEFLIQEIMSRLLNSSASEDQDPSFGTNWQEIETLLHLLADHTVRSSMLPLTRLPEVIYIILACLRIGADGKKHVYHIYKNTISSVMCSEGLTKEAAEELKVLLDKVVESKWLFWQQTRQLATPPGTSVMNLNKNRDLHAADALSELVNDMLHLLSLSTQSTAEEQRRFTTLSTLLTKTAFSMSSSRRRAFIALGVFARRINAFGTSPPVLEALALALRRVTPVEARLASSIVVCLSNMPDPLDMIWVSIALCTFPIDSISAVGLRLLIACLKEIEKSTENIIEVFDKAYARVEPRWKRLERTTQFAVSGPAIYRSFGICCALLQAVRITSAAYLDEVKAALCLLIRLLLKQSPEPDNTFPIPANVLPFLVLLKCLTSNPQDLHSLLQSTGVLKTGFKVTQESDIQSAVIAQCRIPGKEYSILLMSLLMNVLRLADSPAETLRVLQILSEAINRKLPAASSSRAELLPILRNILCKSHQTSLLRIASRIVTMLKTERRDDSTLNPEVTTRGVLEELGFTYLDRQAINHTPQQLEIHKSSITSVIEHVADRSLQASNK